MSGGVVIGVDQLSPEALDGVIEERVTREGTEYGATDVPLARKKAQVREQLHRGEAVIVFDPTTESCNIVLRREL